jgi:hypothetical protein
MSDAEGTRIVFHYRRQVQPKQYETAEVFMDIEHTFPTGLSPEEIENSAKRMAQIVKVGVLTQLGLPFEQDEDTRVIMEVFPTAEKVTSKPLVVPAAAPVEAHVAEPAPPTPPSAPRPAAKRTGPNAAKTSTGGDDVEAAWEHLAANPSLWFYNAPETKQNPKGPDFKATKKAGFTSNGYPMGLWMNTKPEDLVLPDDGYANS